MFEQHSEVSMRFGVLVLVAVFLTTCSSSRQDSRPLTVPPDLDVMVSEGGGFAGQWTGYHVDSTGNITRLSGRPPGLTRSSAGRLSTGEMADLWSLIDSSRILDTQSSSQSGNMTRTISVRARRRAVERSWPLSVPATSPVDALYNDVLRILRNADPNP